MAAHIVNTSSSYVLPQTWPSTTPQLKGALSQFLAGWSTWQYVLTFILGMVVYDQGK